MMLGICQGCANKITYIITNYEPMTKHGNINMMFMLTQLSQYILSNPYVTTIT